MNEKIKQLAEQAGFYFYDMHDVDGQDLGETIEADSWGAAEKFAELIVRECIDTLQRSKDNFGSTDPQILKGARDALTISIYDIQNRFEMRED